MCQHNLAALSGRGPEIAATNLVRSTKYVGFDMTHKSSATG